jgi:RNA polymerase sigma factor for flagellar operon FliA
MQTLSQRDALIKKNVGLVRALATRIRDRLSSRLDLDELISFGHTGLVEAADRWDPARGVTFSTFAYYRINGAIYDGLRQGGQLPRRQYVRFAASANQYLGHMAEGDSPYGAGESTRRRVGDLADTLNDLAAIFVTSMNAPEQPEPADPSASDAFDEVARGESRVALAEALGTLPDKERRLLELHYFEEETLCDAGRRLGMSKSWASRLHARAVRQLARELEDREEGETG